MSHIVPLPALTDNYIWAFATDEAARSWAVVDPGEASPVLKWLQQQQATLSHILLTHHHHDHIDGIPELLNDHPSAIILGSKSTQIPWITHAVEDGDVICIGHVTPFNVMAVPGHTLDHIVWWNDTWLFCGDTLFSLGCGRVFEGTMAQMYDSIRALMQLPDQLWLCPGHEYTLDNLAFIRHLMPKNPTLDVLYPYLTALRQNQQPTLPTRLHFEKKHNPFCNTTNPAFIQKMIAPFCQQDGLLLFEALRQAKDRWRTGTI